MQRKEYVYHDERLTKYKKKFKRTEELQRNHVFMINLYKKKSLTRIEYEKLSSMIIANIIRLREPQNVIRPSTE